MQAAISISFFSHVEIAAKGYLAKLEEDPNAIITLGDSAYNRSNVAKQMGMGLPVPLEKDGAQQRVRIS